MGKFVSLLIVASRSNLLRALRSIVTVLLRAHSCDHTFCSLHQNEQWLAARRPFFDQGYAAQIVMGRNIGNVTSCVVSLMSETSICSTKPERLCDFTRDRCFTNIPPSNTDLLDGPVFYPPLSKHSVEASCLTRGISKDMFDLTGVSSSDCGHRLSSTFFSSCKQPRTDKNVARLNAQGQKTVTV